MALIRDIKIGMSVGTQGLEKGLKRAEGAVSTFEARATSLKGVLAGLAGALALRELGRGLAAGIGGAVQSASDLNEQISKSRTVFGAAAGGVEADAQKMADSFGYPKAQFIEGASSIGLIAKASGLAQADAAKMGSSFASLAADASSFFNVPVDEALMAIRSGLVGEAEPMRRFGVLLNETAVKAEAMALGLSKTGKDLTEGMKVQARASLITKGMADAQGDLARTASSAANQIRTVWGRLENLGADLGTAIQPATDAVLTLANTAVARLGEAITANKEAMTAWVTGAAAGGGIIFDAFEKAGKGIATVLDVLDALNLAFKTNRLGLAYLQVALADFSLGANRAGLAWERLWGIDNEQTQIDVQNAIFAVFDAEKNVRKLEDALNGALVGKSNKEKFTAIFDEIKNAAMGAVKPVVSLADATKGLSQALAGVYGMRVGGGIGGIAAALAIGNVPKAAAAGGAVAAAKAEKPKGFEFSKDTARDAPTHAAAVLAGSQEAYAAQVRAVQGMGEGDTIKEVAKLNKQQLAEHKKMNGFLNQIVSKATGAPFSVMPFPA